MVHLPTSIVRKKYVDTIRRQLISKLIFDPLCLNFKHEVCKYVGNYMNSPELVTGISVNIFLLTISKLPPTFIVPKSMSRARFRSSRLGLADITSKDGTLSSFKFESFLQQNKNIMNIRIVEHHKLSLYWIYFSSMLWLWSVCPFGAFGIFISISSKIWDLIHKFNVNEPVLLFFVDLILYSCKLYGISITYTKKLSNIFRVNYLFL